MSVKRKAKEQNATGTLLSYFTKKNKAIEEENTNNLIASSSTSDSASGNTANTCAGAGDKVDSISIITHSTSTPTPSTSNFADLAGAAAEPDDVTTIVQGQAFTVLEAGDIIKNTASFDTTVSALVSDDQNSNNNKFNNSTHTGNGNKQNSECTDNCCNLNDECVYREYDDHDFKDYKRGKSAGRTFQKKKWLDLFGWLVYCRKRCK